MGARSGWRFAVPHFRGCSGEINLAPRAYHSGDYEEIGWILARCARGSAAPVRGRRVARRQCAAALGRGGRRQRRADGARGGGRVLADRPRGRRRRDRPRLQPRVYTRMFLRTMKPKALRKLAQHPGLFDRERLLAARDLYEFDNVFTAPLHGFATPTTTGARLGQAAPARIRIPALVLNARNDPFVPAARCRAGRGGPHVTLWQPRTAAMSAFRRALPGPCTCAAARGDGWMQHAL
jgi:predicted alpha/beta-fold hydrolase